MSDIVFEFIRIKEELLTASKFLTEHLNDFENYNPVTFNNQLLTIQSKLTTLYSLTKNRSQNFNKMKDVATDLLLMISDIERAENDISRAWNIGRLAGATSIYLNEVNSVILQIN